MPSKFNPEQEKFLIEQFALRTPIAKIKQDFKILFEVNPPGEALIQFKEQKVDLIKRVSAEILPDVKRCRLAHVSIRMRHLDDLLESAMTPRVIRSYKISDTEYAQDMAPDFPACAKFLQLAREEEYAAKRILLEKYKLDLDTTNNSRETGFNAVEVDDGFDSEVPLIE